MSEPAAERLREERARWLRAFGDEERALVRELGDRIGYGRMMQLAELIWDTKMPGGAISNGPCTAFLVRCPHPVEDDNGHCDICCGAGRITKGTLALLTAKDERIARLEVALRDAENIIAEGIGGVEAALMQVEEDGGFVPDWDWMRRKRDLLTKGRVHAREAITGTEPWPRLVWEGEGTDQLLFVGRLWAGSVTQWTTKAVTPEYHGKWRAWISDSDDGSAIGWFDTKDQARAAVEAEARKAIAGVEG